MTKNLPIIIKPKYGDVLEGRVVTHYSDPVEEFHTHQNENNQENSQGYTHAKNRRDFELIALSINRLENRHLVQWFPW